jgi:hypothetical protein
MTWKGLLEAADDGRTYLHDSGYYGSTLNYMRGTELAEKMKSYTEQNISAAREKCSPHT